MKYQLDISRYEDPSTQRPSSGHAPPADGADGTAGDGASHGRSHYPVIRRFPPVILFLTRSEQDVEEQLQAACLHSFKQSRPIEQICSDLYACARRLGYHVTIGVQEVYSSNMPSFPRETVMTSLLMVDFTPL